MTRSSPLSHSPASEQRYTLRQQMHYLLKLPYAQLWQALQERFAQERLGVAASGLTFTTVIALVPLFTLLLAVFTAFPAFAKLEHGVEQWLTQSLFPEAISRQVMSYLNVFTSKAHRLGAVGFGVFVLTAISLALTVDRTLNLIWHTKAVRPLAQRVLVYWALMTLLPLLIAADIALSNSVLHATKSLGMLGSFSWRGVLGGFNLLLSVAVIAAVYKYVPAVDKRAPVLWRQAIAGAVWASLGLWLARKALGLYLQNVPSLSLVYGAFATVPILLLWLYLVWLVLLSGAVIAAHLHSHEFAPSAKRNRAGATFDTALAILQALEAERGAQVATDASANAGGKTNAKGLSWTQLQHRCKASPSHLQPALDALHQLDWVGTLDDGRVLLLQPLANLDLAPLAKALLWHSAAHNPALFNKPLTQWRGQDVLPQP